MIIFSVLNPDKSGAGQCRASGCPDTQEPGRSPNPLSNLEVNEITENRRRNQTLTLRLTDGEKKKILAKARKAKISTTDFIIASTDNSVIKTPEDLRPVISQLKQIGNNINQIAVKVNSGAVYSVNFDEVLEMQNKIYEKVYEIANADSQIH